MKEEQRGKVRPGKSTGFFETFKSALKAQNGIREELQLEVKCGGWIDCEGFFPDTTC